MEEQQRMQSTYPEEGMEQIFIGVIGIQDDADEIERQRKTALTLNVDWLIHLRELSEAVQLYKMIGCVRFTQLKEWHHSILAFFLRQGERGIADCLRAEIRRTLFTPFTSMKPDDYHTGKRYPMARYKTEDGEILGDFPLSSIPNSYIKNASEHLHNRLSDVELVETLSSFYNAIKEEDRDHKSNNARSCIFNHNDTVQTAITSDCGVCEGLSTCSLNHESQDKTVSRPGDDFTLVIDGTDLL